MNTTVFRRLDILESDLGAVKKTDEGYAHFYARATRTGVFKYLNSDGSVRRELRHPDEVFSVDSMKTLENKPITNDHPVKMVDARNSREYTVGMTGHEVTKDGIFLKTKAIITDQGTVDDIIEKGKVQVSCGYNCEHDMTPGNYDGEDYDLIQRNIRYNHLAVVKVGRAGPEAKIRLDVMDAIMVDESNFKDVSMNKKENHDILSNNDLQAALLNLIRAQYDRSWVYFRDILGNEVIYEVESRSIELGGSIKGGIFKQEFKILDDKVELIGNIKEIQEVTSFKVIDQLREYQRKEDKMDKIIIDGVEQEVSEAFKKAFDSKSEKSVKEKEDKISELQAQVDSLKEKLPKEDAEDSKVKFDSLVNEAAKSRLKLYEAAKSHCDEAITSKLDSMTDMEIKKAVIATTIKKDSLNLDEKDDVYINARFDIVMESPKEESKSDSSKVLGSAIIAARHDGKMKPNEDPRMNNYKKSGAMSKSETVKV